MARWFGYLHGSAMSLDGSNGPGSKSWRMTEILWSLRRPCGCLQIGTAVTSSDMVVCYRIFSWLWIQVTTRSTSAAGKDSLTATQAVDGSIGQLSVWVASRSRLEPPKNLLGPEGFR